MDNVAKGVNRACVHITRLDAHDGFIVQRWQGIGAHSALTICRDTHDPFPSHTEHTQSFEDTDMDFFTDDNSDRRRTEQTLRLDIPALARC